jgi:OPT family oligopeptide transporter
MDHNPVMIAAGALVGLRVTIWMSVSGLILAFLLGPYAQEYLWVNLDGETVAAVTKPARAWKEIGLWLGAPIMVASGLLAFAFQWKTIARALSGIGKKSEGDDDVQDGVEVPNSWFVAGMVASASGVIFIANSQFGVPVHLGVLAVALTFVLALVACRATGESDITPTGAMGKIMQLTYGVLIPQSATANLMTAGITAGAASSSADLLNDLKSGYLLGANPKRQFLAQFFGIFTGTIATVIGFKLLVPDATALLGKTLADGTEIAPAFPAPAAVAWKAVADVFNSGIGNLHEMHRSAIFVGLAIGIALTLIDRFAPKDTKKFLPSATGVGLGFILPFQYPLSMLIGALIGYYWNKRNEKQCEGYLVPLASGIIAGVSIMGVVAAALNNFVFVNGGAGH